MNFMKNFLLPVSVAVIDMLANRSRSGAVVFSLPVREAYELTLMSGATLVQGRTLARLTPTTRLISMALTMGMECRHFWKNGGPGICQTRVRPERYGFLRWDNGKANHDGT